MGFTSSKMSETKNQAEVVLVGCGCPLRGMGWYHAVQMLGGECPSAKLSYIVEPWFLGPGKSPPWWPCNHSASTKERVTKIDLIRQNSYG